VTFTLAQLTKSPPAREAGAVLTVVPAHADPSTFRPLRHACARFVDHAGDFVAWRPRVHEAWPAAFLREGIAVADSARLHANPHVPRPRLRDVPLDDLEVRACLGQLRRFHLSHHFSPGAHGGLSTLGLSS
jgi:hypothetical protein